MHVTHTKNSLVERSTKYVTIGNPTCMVDFIAKSKVQDIF